MTGDSYAAELFSTRTVIYEIGDVAKGGQNLESYHLIVNGEPYRYTDTNIWGVTFVPGQDRFFATASFSGHRYLVDGSITRRTMLVLRDKAECPSLSPDGLRLAYKKRVSDGVYPTWCFYLLDLTTNTESELAETRNIEDQVNWLDNDTVMYAVPSEGSEEKINDIWTLNIKGGEPQLVIEGGESPTVATYPTAL